MSEAEGSSSSRPAVGDGLSPVGTVLGPGSTSLRMQPQERQAATMLAMGYSYKKIGHDLGITTGAVGAMVARLASRIPGQGNPRQKVSAWMWVYGTQLDGQ